MEHSAFVMQCRLGVSLSLVVGDGESMYGQTGVTKQTSLGYHTHTGSVNSFFVKGGPSPLHFPLFDVLMS